MSKRRRPDVQSQKRARWDRRQVFITIVAVLIVLTLIASSLLSLLYRAT